MSNNAYVYLVQQNYYYGGFVHAQNQCRISNLSKEKVQVSSAVKSLCTVAVRCPELNFEFG
jgi:hypothetical protein